MIEKFILFLCLLFFIVSCGLEESSYIKEPEVLSVRDNGTEYVEIYFTGFNQEEQGEYLFVGYDVMYYFNNSSEAKRCQVKNPIYENNSKLLSHTDLTHDRDVLFSGFSETEKKLFFQKITFPVTLNMIKDVLHEGNNNNVYVYFHNKTINDDVGEYNPYEANNVYIMIDELFPNINDYLDKDWYDSVTFKGFYDKDFYDYVIDSLGYDVKKEENSTYTLYSVYFYVVARGFPNITSNYSSFNSLDESISSKVIEVKFRVNN